MLEQGFGSVVTRVPPLIECIGIELASKLVNEGLILPFAHNDFRWLEPLKQLIHVGRGALCHQEFAGRNIEERYACRLFVEKYRREVIVGFLVDDVIAIGHARRDQFGYTTLYNGLGG